MSLFQCAKCGCLENTALSNFSSYLAYMHASDDKKRPHPAYKEWKRKLGLPEDQPFDPKKGYCSACSPVWYTKNGDYGLGDDYSDANRDGPPFTWHGQFRRQFLPKGEFVTNDRGDLWHRKTHEPPDKYFSDREYMDCGCHCSGGCGDPYAPCAKSCKEHVPF